MRNESGMGVAAFFIRLLNKTNQELYRLQKPKLWRSRCQLNGIPTIYAIDKLDIGKDVSLNSGIVIQCSGGVQIGNRVTISRDVLILTVGLDTDNWLENSSKKYRDHVKKPVVISDGVWVGARAVLCPGSYIAKNSIVAAGAVVSGRLEEENAIYGGVPAKFIKKI